MVVLLWCGCIHTLIYLLFDGNLNYLSFIREFLLINRLFLAVFYWFPVCFSHFPHLIAKKPL